MHHVVAEFHILDDLATPEGRRAGSPRVTACGTADRYAPAKFESSLEADRIAQIVRVVLAAVGLDVRPDRVELHAQRLMSDSDRCAYSGMSAIAIVSSISKPIDYVTVTYAP